LLPGLDFGDSASFQNGVGWLTLTPRQAYPLYYALGNVVAWLDPHEPAHAMNLASAIYGAIAVGLTTWVAAEFAASTVAGVAAGLFLTFSYTFWSQAITAEVYTLHLLIVAATLIALLEWQKRPTRARLSLFYAIYALGFGNHLSMILLLPGLVVFLLIERTPGRGDPFAGRNILLAVVIAAAGALQYVWNFKALWWELEPPQNFAEALGKFWFDVTKSDWRETLVMGVSESGLRSRPAMYWWDLRQQFGVPGILLATIGITYLAVRWPKRAFLMLLLYVSALMFAWTYNVGDAYIFFLPSHYIVALCAGAGVAALIWLAGTLFPRPFSLAPRLRAAALRRGRLAPSPLPLAPFAVAALCLLYPAWRGYDDFPALDRSWDVRAVQVMDQLTAPLAVEHNASCVTPSVSPIYGLDANWQVQNAAEYYMRRHKPFIPWFVTVDLKWLTPANRGGFNRFLADNAREGSGGASRPVVITVDTLRNVTAADADVTPPVPEHAGRTLAEALAQVEPGLVYALTVLRPNREFPLDRAELQGAWTALTGDHEAPPLDDYTIVVGQVGRRPTLIRTGSRPFRVNTELGRLKLDVRMESWLPTDTIRRSGFGHVIANRRHVLAVDRGVSLVVLGRTMSPVLTEYRSGLFAPVPRYVFAESATAPCYR
jgi:hypothetical protein